MKLTHDCTLWVVHEGGDVETMHFNLAMQARTRGSIVFTTAEEAETYVASNQALLAIKSMLPRMSRAQLETAQRTLEAMLAPPPAQEQLPPSPHDVIHGNGM